MSSHCLAACRRVRAPASHLSAAAAAAHALRHPQAIAGLNRPGPHREHVICVQGRWQPGLGCHAQHASRGERREHHVRVAHAVHGSDLHIAGRAVVCAACTSLSLRQQSAVPGSTTAAARRAQWHSQVHVSQAGHPACSVWRVMPSAHLAPAAQPPQHVTSGHGDAGNRLQAGLGSS